MTDYGAPDDEFEWPDIASMKLVDVARMMDDVERQASEANARKDRLSRRRREAKMLLTAALEDAEQDSVVFTNSSGRRVSYTPYPFEEFNITNLQAFREWAGEQQENYFEPGLRKDVFRDEMRRRSQDGEPLPPGVSSFTDRRLSRSTAVKSRGVGGPGAQQGEE